MFGHIWVFHFLSDYKWNVSFYFGVRVLIASELIFLCLSCILQPCWIHLLAVGIFSLHSQACLLPRGTGCFFLSDLYIFISFPYLTCWLKFPAPLARAMLKKSDESRHHLSLLLILGGSIKFLTIKYYVNYRFFVGVLYQVEEVLFYTCFSEGFLSWRSVKFC